MKVTQSTANLVQLTRFGLVNCYLVREDDGFTLVDTGLPGGAEDILSAAAKAGAPIRRILLTHAHPDHIGSVDALKQTFSTLQLAISARDARMLRGDASLDGDEPQVKMPGGATKIQSEPTENIVDGELYGSLRCLRTPGHTPGHFCFFDERDGTLLAGDALLTLGREVRVVSDPPWYMPLPRFFTWHAPTAVASASRLRDRLGSSIARVAPGHGPVLPVKPADLAAACDRAARKEGSSQAGSR